EPPISPHLAAERAGSPLHLPALADWVHLTASQYNTLHSTHSSLSVLVETAGGAFSPLTLRETQVDLARLLDPAIWILVAPDALGCLHSVAAVYRALAPGGRVPDHLVLRAPAEADASTGTNALELERLGLPRPVCTVRRDCPDDLQPLVDLLLAPSAGA